MDSTILQSELDKALSRHKTQTESVASTYAIIHSPLALPSLKAIAKRRLPKLEEILTETNIIISELQLALKTGTQPDLLDTNVESPPTSPRGRRTVPT